MTALLARPTPLLLGWALSLLALAGPVSGVHAQGKKALRLLVGAAGKEPAPDEEEPRVVLRPNGAIDQSFGLYLLNPGPGIKKDVKVRVLALGPDGKVGAQVLTGSLAVLGVDKVTPVKFDKTLPAPPAPKDGKEKEAKEVPAPLPLRGPPFRLRVEVEEGGKAVPFVVPVLLQSPRQYTEVTPPEYKEEARRLSVKVLGKEFLEPPIPVALVLPPALNPGLQAIEAGQLNGSLSRATPQVELSADGIIFRERRPRSGRVYLSVDGYERAYGYTGTFAPGVQQLLDTTRPRVRILMDHYRAAPLAELEVPVQVDALLGADMDVEVSFRQAGSGRYTPLERRPGFRQQVVGAATGEDGNLVFRARVQDWVVPVPTAGTTGRLEIRVRLRDRADSVVPLTQELDLENETASLFNRGPASRYSRWAPLRFDRAENALFAEVVLDAADPRVVLGGLGNTTSPGKALRPEVRVERSEEQAPVNRVVFYLGETAKDLNALKAFVEGRPKDAERTVWEPEEGLVVPEDLKGRLIVNAMATTLSGRAGSAKPAVLAVVPAPTAEEAAKAEQAAAEAKIKPGEISGRILRGGRPQPKADVLLLDDKLQAKSTAKADKDGQYKFMDLKPGTYTVYATQPAFNTQGLAVVTIPEGKERQIKGVDIRLMVKGK